MLLQSANSGATINTTQLNYRQFLALLLIFTFISKVQSQNTSIELGKAFNSSADKAFTVAALSHQIKKIHLTTRFMLGNGNYVIQPNDTPRYPFIDQDGSYIFAGQGLQPGVLPADVGIKTYDTKTDQYLHIYATVDYTIPISNISSKTRFTTYIGPSIAYINEVFLVEATDGTFISNFYPDTDFTLTVTQYLRYLDLGGHAQATLQHNFSEKLGLRLSLNLFYFIDEQLSAQLGAGIAF